MARGQGPIPIVGYHRGCPLHNHQDESRLAIVRAEIDAVIAMSDLRDLVAWAEFVGHAPESRMLSGEKAISLLGAVGGARQKLPRGLTVEYVESCTAGLSTEGWRSRICYGTLIDQGDRGAVERDRPLPP